MLENIKAGTRFNSNKFIFETKDIIENDYIYTRINGKSYVKNNDVSLSDLIYIKMLHYNYNGKIVVGEMIINKVIIDEVQQIFENLFVIKYQINSMLLIDDFWIDNDAIKSDRNSVINNNTSSFCYRKIAGQSTLSNHSLGIAIDINPFDNPYTPRNENGTFDDSLLTEYEKSILVNRKEKAKYNKHIITLGDNLCKIFANVGFECGGIWPLQSNKWPCDWQHFEPDATKMLIVMQRIEENKNQKNHPTK